MNTASLRQRLSTISFSRISPGARSEQGEIALCHAAAQSLCFWLHSTIACLRASSLRLKATPHCFYSLVTSDTHWIELVLVLAAMGAVMLAGR